MNILRTFAPALLLLAASTVEAQAGRNLQASFGLTSAQGDALTLTKSQTGGFNLEIGYSFSPEGYGVEFLAHAGYVRLPAKKPSSPATAEDASTYTLSSPHFGVDLVYRPWKGLPLALTTGPDIHVWQVDKRNTLDAPGQGQQGLKLGWRVGAQYRLSDLWSFSLNYTFTEWRSNPEMPAVNGLNPSRPAYLTAMAHYRF